QLVWPCFLDMTMSRLAAVGVRRRIPCRSPHGSRTYAHVGNLLLKIYAKAYQFLYQSRDRSEYRMKDIAGQLCALPFRRVIWPPCHRTAVTYHKFPVVATREPGGVAIRRLDRQIGILIHHRFLFSSHATLV